MTKKKSTKNWLKKHTKDKYVKMSMHLAIDQEHSINSKKLTKSTRLSSANIIIDLEHHLDPGRNIYHEITSIKLIAADQIAMEPIEGIKFICGDINNSEHRDKIRQIITSADLVLSDMPPTQLV